MSTSAAGIRAILFDLDGTLVDTYRLYLEAYGRALKPFVGRRPTAAEIVERHPASERGFLAGWVPAVELDACHDAMLGHYAALHDALCDGLYDGVREMLAALRAAGFPLGLVTGKGRRAWDASRAALGLDGFSVVVTDEDVERPKPEPDGILTAVAALRIPAAAALYVGDSSSDLEAGRRAGACVAAALWAKTAAGEAEAFATGIAPLEPDWIFERPADVVRVLAPWCGMPVQQLS